MAGIADQRMGAFRAWKTEPPTSKSAAKGLWSAQDPYPAFASFDDPRDAD